MLILGALNFHTLAVACLLHPIKWHGKPNKIPFKQNTLIEKGKKVVNFNSNTILFLCTPPSTKIAELRFLNKDLCSSCIIESYCFRFRENHVIIRPSTEGH